MRAQELENEPGMNQRARSAALIRSCHSARFLMFDSHVDSKLHAFKFPKQRAGLVSRRDGHDKTKTTVKLTLLLSTYLSTPPRTSTKHTKCWGGQ